MRVIPPNLAAKLDAGITTLAQAWRLTRADGTIVAVTQHDRDVSFDGTTFIAAQSFLSGDHEKEIDLAPNRSALSGTLTTGAITPADLALGRWDQAKVEAFWVDWTNPADFIAMWQGLVAGASWQGCVFELDIVGPQSVLNREIGRVYSRTCDAAVGDARCKVALNIPTRMINAAIVGISSDRSFTIALPAGKASDDFLGGVLTMMSGPAFSWRCDISRIEADPTNWKLFVARPFPVFPLAGDTISLTMSCDKAFATCKDRFSNALNFRGQPTLPGDDIAFGGPPVRGNDGGKR